jgi:hypothetical protein
MSRDWLEALRVGDVILSRFAGYDDPLEVVRGILHTRQRWGVLVKRKHLKVAMPMMECDDEYVMYQWSSQVGQTHNKFKEWKVMRNGELLDFIFTSPSQVIHTPYNWEKDIRYTSFIH